MDTALDICMTDEDWDRMVLQLTSINDVIGDIGDIGDKGDKGDNQ